MIPDCVLWMRTAPLQFLARFAAKCSVMERLLQAGVIQLMRFFVHVLVLVIAAAAALAAAAVELGPIGKEVIHHLSLAPTDVLPDADVTDAVLLQALHAAENVGVLLNDSVLLVIPNARPVALQQRIGNPGGH